MPSREFRWLLANEIHELAVSRAYWLLLLIIGPLIGHGFISAVDLYAEASGIDGRPAALPQGLSALDGILVPTFGGYDLAVTLLLPFIAIRLASSDKESGALKLLIQAPVGEGVLLAAKELALLGGWLVAWLPGLMALGLWRAYGGYLHVPEVMNLLLGHFLRVIVAAGVAFTAAAMTNGAASAAIVTLGFTIGTWVLDFVAMGRGGPIQKLATYTPTAALRLFEQGQLKLSTVIVSLAIGASGSALGWIWLHPGRGSRSRLLRSLGVTMLLGLVVVTAPLLRSSWDVSEDRRNSFSIADEAALRQIKEPLRIRVSLAAEDARLMDLERSILSKLRRILPSVEVEYASQSRAGLFESADDHYGEVWYQLGGRSLMSRSTTEAIVLETLYQLADIPRPQAVESTYSGHPLATRPKGAASLFYGIWPSLVGLSWWVLNRKWR